MNEDKIREEQIRTVVSSIAILLVTICSMIGISMDMNETTTAFSAVGELIVVGWAIWKNHNFTREACQSQVILDSLKDNRLSEEELVEFIESSGADHAKC